MNKPNTIIFFGFLAILMSIGNHETEFIPSELKLAIGFLLIGYGIYQIYKPTKKRRSYIFLAIGVLLLKSPDFFYPNNPYELNLMKILVYIFGFGLVIYGLNLLFKEKREKGESGSIE